MSRHFVVPLRLRRHDLLALKADREKHTTHERWFGAMGRGDGRRHLLFLLLPLRQQLHLLFEGILGPTPRSSGPRGPYHTDINNNTGGVVESVLDDDKHRAL